MKTHPAKAGAASHGSSPPPSRRTPVPPDAPKEFPTAELPHGPDASHSAAPTGLNRRQSHREVPMTRSPLRASAPPLAPLALLRPARLHREPGRAHPRGTGRGARAGPRARRERHRPGHPARRGIQHRLGHQRPGPGGGREHDGHAERFTPLSGTTGRSPTWVPCPGASRALPLRIKQDPGPGGGSQPDDHGPGPRRPVGRRDHHRPGHACPGASRAAPVASTTGARW